MKIEKSNVTKILISGIQESHKLDSITIILEDIADAQGKIIVECYGKSWSTYFGAMGFGTNILTFLCSVNTDYLAGRLYGSGSTTIQDNDQLIEDATKTILKRRRDLDLESMEARNLYNDIIDGYLINDNNDKPNSKLMYDIFGEEWWYNIPTTSHPNWIYILRITKTVLEALRKIKEEGI